LAIYAAGDSLTQIPIDKTSKRVLKVAEGYVHVIAKGGQLNVNINC